MHFANKFLNQKCSDTLCVSVYLSVYIFLCMSVYLCICLCCVFVCLSKSLMSVCVYVLHAYVC